MHRKRTSPTRKCNSRSGVVIVIVALGLVAVVGMAGLVSDLGRLYIAKNELQAFTDAAAVAAAASLDGSETGVNNARTEATEDRNHWNFDTENVPTKVVEFSASPDGPWEATPTGLAAAAMQYVRVSATADMTLYLSRALPGVGASEQVTAASVGGLLPRAGLSDGGFPASPDVHDESDPDFGFRLGELYTLAYDLYTGPVTTETISTCLQQTCTNWSNSGTLCTEWECDLIESETILVYGEDGDAALESTNGFTLFGCPGDQAAAALGWGPGFADGTMGRSQRGYVDLADRSPSLPGGGADLLRDGILGRLSYGLPITIGYTLTMEPGAMTALHTEFRNRVLQDTNPTTGSYFTQTQTDTNTPTAAEMSAYYRSPYNVAAPAPPGGNGRRIVTLPVNRGASDVVVGFAAFFLPPDPCQDRVGPDGKTYNPCCAEYIGTSVFNGGMPGGGGASLYRAALVR